MNAFFGGMWSGMGMITDLDRKVVDRFLAAPASRLAIVLSQVIRAGITAMIQTLILLLVGLALGVRVHGGDAWLARRLRRCVPPRGGVRRFLERPGPYLPTAGVDDRDGDMVGLPLMFLSTILVTVTIHPGLDQGDHAR